MAALAAGVQYGLSSHSNFHENKSLIFVKLTDSAQRAIEDFLRNRQNTTGRHQLRRTTAAQWLRTFGFKSWRPESDFSFHGYQDEKKAAVSQQSDIYTRSRTPQQNPSAEPLSIASTAK